MIRVSESPWIGRTINLSNQAQDAQQLARPDVNNASSLSEVVREVELGGPHGFNSGALSIEPFGGSRWRGVWATIYAFSMVFLG